MTPALGLGLGLRWTRHRAVFITTQPDYNSRYGLPDDLEVIALEQLINTEELALNTEFVVSSQPRTREYVFNISQALAAPDGFYKPMILANGQSPGPLVEANIGDTSM